MINIILGIQSCSSKFGCPFCEGYKVNEKGKPTNKRGKWVKGKRRTVNSLTANYNEYKTKGGGIRKNLKNFKNAEFKPMTLKTNAGDEWVAKTLPPAPLHTNLLGPVNDALEKLEKDFEEQIEVF